MGFDSINPTLTKSTDLLLEKEPARKGRIDKKQSAQQPSEGAKKGRAASDGLAALEKRKPAQRPHVLSAERKVEGSQKGNVGGENSPVDIGPLRTHGRGDGDKDYGKGPRLKSKPPEPGSRLQDTMKPETKDE